MKFLPHIKKNLFAPRRGFTIFLATLVSSLALAIGIAIFDLTVRSLALSGTLAQSQYAIYAADTGAECALYWDSKAPLHNDIPSIFATSSDFEGTTSSGFMCSGVDITTSGWQVDAESDQATTTFEITLTNPNSSQIYCVEVEVGKYTDANETLFTNIYSHGYNTCTDSPDRLERLLQVKY
jgi:hypothetical protein